LQFLRRSGCAERFAGEYRVSLITDSSVSKICANIASNRAYRWPWYKQEE